MSNVEAFLEQPNCDKWHASWKTPRKFVTGARLENLLIVDVVLSLIFVTVHGSVIVKHCLNSIPSL